jgi:hypothetical protein
MKASLATCLVLCASLVACGEERAKPAPASAPPISAEATVTPEPAPAPAAPKVSDLSLGTGHEMRSVVRDGRLTLVPIIATAAIPETKYITLDEGMRTRKVTVREMPGDWQVDTVRITNRSRFAMLGLRGELILDAKQDRVLAEDVVIEPGATREVAARCIEHDRDRGGSRFRSGNAMAELSLRRLVAHSDQTAVWAQVDVINARLGISNHTKTYRHAAARHARAPVSERAGRLATQLAAHPDRDRMVGLAIALDGQVLAIDRFATPELYRSLEPKLLGSYAATDDGVVLEGRQLTPDAVRALASLGENTDASFVALQALRDASGN